MLTIKNERLNSHWRRGGVRAGDERDLASGKRRLLYHEHAGLRANDLLSGGVAVLYVGAPTEMEMKEKKDRVDDALSAAVVGAAGSSHRSTTPAVDWRGGNHPARRRLGGEQQLLVAALAPIAGRCGAYAGCYRR